MTATLHGRKTVFCFAALVWRAHGALGWVALSRDDLARPMGERIYAERRAREYALQKLQPYAPAVAHAHSEHEQKPVRCSTCGRMGTAVL
jgi:hypothetical protein